MIFETRKSIRFVLVTFLSSFVVATVFLWFYQLESVLTLFILSFGSKQYFSADLFLKFWLDYLSILNESINIMENHLNHKTNTNNGNNLDDDAANDDPTMMNASQILHLALQKMDGIIASNSNSDPDLMAAASVKSFASSSSSSNYYPNNNNNNNPNNVDRQSINNLLVVESSGDDDHSNQSSNSANNNNNNNGKKSQELQPPTPSSSKNYSQKQDRLNRLLQELKDYSREDDSESSSIDLEENISNVAVVDENSNVSVPSGDDNKFVNNNGNLSGKINTSSNINNHHNQQQHRKTSPESSFFQESSNNNNANNSDNQNKSITSSTGGQQASYYSNNSQQNNMDPHYHHHHHNRGIKSQEEHGDNLQQPQHNKQQSGDEYHHGSGIAGVNSKKEKIIQLESVVTILRNQLLNTEELFKKALVSKKTLENANCDLLSIVDKLKLDLMHLESQQKMLKEQNLKLEDELEQMKTRFLEKDTEISSLRLTMAKIVRTTGYVLSGNELALLRGKTIASDYIKNKFKENYHEMVFGPYSRGNYFYSEPASRRDSAATYSGGPGGSVVGAGGRFSPIAPPRLHRQSPTMAASSIPAEQSSPVHVLPSSSNNNQIMSTTPQQQQQQHQQHATMLRSTSFEDMKMDSKQEIVPEEMIRMEQSKEQQNGAGAGGVSSSSSSGGKLKIGKGLFSTLPHNTKAFRQVPRSNEDDHRNFQTMSQSLIDGEQIIAGNSKAFSTPNSPMVTLKPQTVPTSSSHPHHQSPSSFGVTFGKRFCWLRKSSRTASAPDLAPDEEIIQISGGKANIVSPRINLEESKPKGFRKIFSRKRSTSSLSGISDSFSRGGLRATSGPRLGFSSQEKRFQNVNIPFSNWGTTLVADWFAMIGLGMYVQDCKRWCKNGEHLMKATSWEVEKELGIKNSLHRKKLRLAVAAMNNEEDDLLKCAGKLDYLWVARWLDDIGLPQYKESFIDARVDGRVLHYLTIDDLLHLKVTSQLHFASIRAAIKVLRDNNYNGQCLKRRAAPEEAQKTEWSPSEVAIWSSHRIMEWLRSIDLSEYAPNLRGSGVHGALILFENAFNADLFATLLSIPTNKTLLRRHISSKFKQLIGDELNKIKHEYECMPNYQPMIPGAKIRAHKKGHFSLRKKRADFELSDYVCPMAPVAPATPLTSKYSALNKMNQSIKTSTPTPTTSIADQQQQKKEDSPASSKTMESMEKNSHHSEDRTVDNLSMKSEPKSYTSAPPDTQTNHSKSSSENIVAEIHAEDSVNATTTTITTTAIIENHENEKRLSKESA